MKRETDDGRCFMRIMRSWMFVPGHQRRMIDKAYGLKLDVAMFDLEDGVPPSEKNTARAMMGETLDRPSGGMLRFVRIHPAGTKEMEVDLPAVIRPRSGWTHADEGELPRRCVAGQRGSGVSGRNKRDFNAEVFGCSPRLRGARGLIQAAAIAASSPRLVGLMFGAEDFAIGSGDV